MSTPEVTVVVPTRDRPIPLARCLTALAAQDVGPIEIVVVDDGSSDESTVAAIVGRVDGARVVRAEGRGPAVARNLGARLASAPVICFTDDDCAPGPEWARLLVAALDSAGAAAGPTRNADVRASCAEAAQTITNHLVDRSRRGVRGDETVGFVPSCNLAVRGDTMRGVPFDEDFPLAAGEDREWCARLAVAGVTIRWVPEAEVRHHQDMPWRSFWRQQVRYGRGARRHHMTQPRGQRIQDVGFYTSLVRRGFADGPRVGALVVVAQAAIAAGIVAETASGWRRTRVRGRTPAGRGSG
jgi:glycosyltransferase involved in cell wall biosynthesis